MEKTTVHSDYFNENYDAVLIDGKTYVELRRFATDNHIPILSYDSEKKIAVVGGGLVEGLNNLLKGVK